MAPRPDLAEIQQAAALFLKPGSVVELRAPKAGTNGTISGYFSDPAKLAQAAFATNGKAAGVYVTVNAVQPDLLARADNRVKSRASTTTGDSEIIRRNWLLFDFDPARAAGISSTNGEHDSALRASRAARDSLLSQGWPEPVVGDSGNGGHLLFRVDLPNDADSTELVKSALKAAAQRYSGPSVALDLSVYNAARISKLYGTTAQKGDSTTDRPHRVSRILDMPESIEVVPGELLHELAAEARPEPQRTNGAPHSGRPVFDPQRWIDEFGIPIARGPVPHQGGSKWVLKNCPFNPEHEAPDAAIFHAADGKMGFKCLHNSCAGKGWREFRELFEPGRSQTQRAWKEDAGKRGAGIEAPAGTDLLYQPYTDTGNAERLVALYGRDIRFCTQMKTWLVWDGLRWNSEDMRRVKVLAKRTMREMYVQAAGIERADIKEAAEKHARKSESSASIHSMLTCAEYEEGVPVSAEALDRNNYLLNFLNGTLDLATGRIRAHQRDDLIGKLVHCNYRPSAECPKFMQFLSRIMGDGPDASEPERQRAERLVNYLQKCFGYALVGDVSEKAVFCFFGAGNNGKTTLLEAIRFILAEYSAQVLIDTLMAHSSRESNASLADLGDLRGARFVTTSEAEEGQRLAVGKLKYLTQGMGAIKTCRKYENPIQFTATHKLFLDANHKPIIRGVEKAVWNRLKPIPFTVTIPPEEMDKSLLLKLQGEAEGVCAWMVRGCALWQREGLGDPPEVTEASAAWQADSDRFPAFLEERCVFALAAWVPVSQLWPAYQNWCEVNKERSVLAKSDFDERLKERGCTQAKREHGEIRAWIGVRFRTQNDDRAGDGGHS